MAIYPNCQWMAVKRIEELIEIEKWLREDPANDIFEQLANVVAVRKAYIDGVLDYHEGYITYWADGRQLSEYRVFIPSEMWSLYYSHGKAASFWVEGVSEPWKDPWSTGIGLTSNLDVWFR